ncbi:hypothetical protein OROMI_026493 [Orobanche minor]
MNFITFGHDEILTYQNNDGNTLLGEGGNGIVYRGFIPNGNPHGMGETHVAIKGVRDIANEEQRSKATEQLRNEIQWLERLNHPNIIRMIGRCLEPNPYAVMELAQGNLLARINELNWEQTLDIINNLADAVNYLQHQNIRHGDIKPENIFLTEDLQVKLGDVGTMMHVDPNLDAAPLLEEYTFAFIDPNSRCKGKAYMSDDIYSLGVTILLLITKADRGVLGRGFFVGAVADEATRHIVVHPHLRTTGCYEEDAHRITNLGLYMTRRGAYGAAELISIEVVILRLGQMRVKRRNRVNKLYLNWKEKRENAIQFHLNPRYLNP